MARTVDRNAKRLLIVESAATQFAKAGYAATAMDDVAAAAGVSKGSLYDYFKDKEDLFYAVFEWCEQRTMLTAMAQLKPERTAKDQILSFAEAVVSALMEQVDLYPVTLEVWAAAAKSGTRLRFAQAMQSLYVQYRGQVEALLHAAQDGGEIRKDVDTKAIAALLVGAVDGLMLQYWLDKSIAPKSWVRSYLLALFEGISTKTDGESK